MITTVLDTLKLSESFKSAGFNEKQAKILAERIGDLANDHLVTREYLDFKLHDLQLRLTLNLGALIAAILTFFKVMEKFF
jgi:hypothetical protein